jgi:hypothetical protein
MAFSLNAETQKMIEDTIISEYEKVIAAKRSAKNTK